MTIRLTPEEKEIVLKFEKILSEKRRHFGLLTNDAVVKMLIAEAHKP